MINTYLVSIFNYNCWFKNNECHRDGDLPAVEWISGDKWWYKNGERHRGGDLPAIKWFDNSEEWYKNGKYHRDGDLPAVEWANGIKCWYKNSKRYYPIEQIVIINMIKIKIMKMGNKWWYTCHN